MNNKLQSNVMKRLEAGLPVTRCQRFCLNAQAAWKQLLKGNPRAIWFHVKGVLRALLCTIQVLWLPH